MWSRSQAEGWTAPGTTPNPRTLPPRPGGGNRPESGLAVSRVWPSLARCLLDIEGQLFERPSRNAFTPHPALSTVNTITLKLLVSATQAVPPPHHQVLALYSFRCLLPCFFVIAYRQPWDAGFSKRPSALAGKRLPCHPSLRRARHIRERLLFMHPLWKQSPTGWRIAAPP